MTSDPRDKAIVSVLYESALISEFLNMKIGIQPTEFGFKLVVSSKNETEGSSWSTHHIKNLFKPPSKQRRS